MRAGASRGMPRRSSSQRSQGWGCWCSLGPRAPSSCMRTCFTASRRPRSARASCGTLTPRAHVCRRGGFAHAAPGRRAAHTRRSLVPAGLLSHHHATHERIACHRLDMPPRPGSTPNDAAGGRATRSCGSSSSCPRILGRLPRRTAAPIGASRRASRRVASNDPPGGWSANGRPSAARSGGRPQGSARRFRFSGPRPDQPCGVLIMRPLRFERKIAPSLVQRIVYASLKTCYPCPAGSLVRVALNLES